MELVSSGERRCWSIITGEYPPRPGGVSDYTRRVALGLAASGERVLVWTAGEGPPARDDRGVEVRTIGRAFGPAQVWELERAHRRLPGARLLVQYTPHAFGLRGANLPLCAWLASSRRRPWVVFHEVCFPLAPRRQPLRHSLLSLAQHGMAAMLHGAAGRSFVTCEAWKPILRRVAPWGPEPVTLPVMSNLPEEVAPELVSSARRAVAGEGELVIGHFGTYGSWFRERLRRDLPRLLSRPGRIALLAGRGGAATAAELSRLHPELAPRLRAVEGAGEEVARHLAACDLLLQPYPDGPTTRRGSLVSVLALGRPAVTCDGPLADPAFREGGIVALARDPEGIVEAAEALLGSPSDREALGRSAALAYRERFALARVIEALTQEPEDRSCASR